MPKAVKASDLFVAALENEGVTHIFGVPGEENLDFVESLRNSKIQLVVTRHEQGAAFMAATYGRLTGRPGVCLSTLGPGALNLVTGAAYALLGAMPMILITGQKPILSSRQARFQVVDIVATMRPLTKLSRQVVSAASIPATVRESFRIATEERLGPVHIELPEDIARETTEQSDLIPIHPIYLPEASDTAVQAAAALLLQAKRPLIMLGAGANRVHLAEPLSAFVKRLGIPFFNTQMGKGAVNGVSDLYVGTAALSERDYIHKMIDRSDLVLAIGHDTVEKPPFLMGQGAPRVIHVGYTPATVERVWAPNAEIVGDIGASLTKLGALLEGKLHPEADFAALKDEVLAHVRDRAEEQRFPLTPQRIVHDVRRAMPADGIVTLDNGMYKIWFARNYRTHVANTLLLDNALATMGAGLPSAMMAAMLNPGKPVLAVCGDGGFMMNAQELETAIRLKLDLVVLILEDNAYGMIRWKQAVDKFQDYGMTFSNPDFVMFAQAHGAVGRRVADSEGLAPALQAAFAGGGVQLVVVPIDYSENIRVLIDELAANVSQHGVVSA
jgi:acetolactate synthase-1/2/3 large subunit